MELGGCLRIKVRLFQSEKINLPIPSRVNGRIAVLSEFEVTGLQAFNLGGFIPPGAQESVYSLQQDAKRFSILCLKVILVSQVVIT